MIGDQERHFSHQETKHKHTKATPWAKQSLSRSNSPPPPSPSTEGSSTTSAARVVTVPIFYRRRPLRLKVQSRRTSTRPRPPPRGTKKTTQQQKTSPSLPHPGLYPTFPNLHSSINMHVYICSHSRQPSICTINPITANYPTSKTLSITSPTWPYPGQDSPYHSLFGISH